MSEHISHLYQACGLSIASDAPIPGLRRRGWSDPPASDSPELTIAMRGAIELDASVGETSLWWVSPEIDGRGKPEMKVEANERGYRLTYNDDVTFLIDRAGGRISAHWRPSRSDADAASHLAGSVLAFALRLRGSVPLHASAVVVDGRALLFIGDPWAGKSTTIAAFSRLGHSILADDIVRIDVVDSRVLAYPGHPRLNLWADSAKTLFGPSNDASMWTEEYSKQVLDLQATGCSFQSAPVPIEAVYLLGERLAVGSDAPSITAVSPSAALVALVRHAYGGCFLDRTMRAREFDVLCQLVEHVPVRELRFGDDLSALVASCRVIAGTDRSRRTGPTSKSPKRPTYEHE